LLLVENAQHFSKDFLLAKMNARAFVAALLPGVPRLLSMLEWVYRLVDETQVEIRFFDQN
jgi:hypothetical protein